MSETILAKDVRAGDRIFRGVHRRFVDVLSVTDLGTRIQIAVSEDYRYPPNAPVTVYRGERTEGALP